MLAIALSLYLEVEVEPSDRFAVASHGEGADLASDVNHLAARVAREVRGDDHVSVLIESEIPAGRGLGSSAALAAAMAAACGSGDPFVVAAGFDGHPENAAASVLGGLVAASAIGGQPVAEPLPLDPELAFVVLVPDRELLTSQARAVLPQTVAFSDATANLGRMGLLLAGLADRTRLHQGVAEDRLHEPARTKLFPQSTTLLAALTAAGASVACWSGAGPSLLGICTDRSVAEGVRQAGQLAMERAGVPGRSYLLDADRTGLVWL